MESKSESRTNKVQMCLMIDPIMKSHIAMVAVSEGVSVGALIRTALLRVYGKPSILSRVASARVKNKATPNNQLKSKRK